MNINDGRNPDKEKLSNLEILKIKTNKKLNGRQRSEQLNGISVTEQNEVLQAALKITALIASKNLGSVSVKRIIQLATEYAKGEPKLTPGSIGEAFVGVALEKANLIPGPIIRDRSGNAEFIDASGQKWDVKAFVSSGMLENPTTCKVGKVNKGAFNIEKVKKTIDKEFSQNHNIIFDTRKLNEIDLKKIKEYIESKDKGKSVLYFPQDFRKVIKNKKS